MNNQKKSKDKVLKEIFKEINSILEDNPLVAPAISLAEYSIKNFSDNDWAEYEKETGNPKCQFREPKTGIELLVDEAVGYKSEKDIAYAKFLLWNIKGFKEGLEDDKEAEGE